MPNKEGNESPGKAFRQHFNSMTGEGNLNHARQAHSEATARNKTRNAAKKSTLAGNAKIYSLGGGGKKKSG